MTDAAVLVATAKAKFEVTRGELWSRGSRGCRGWPVVIRQIESEDTVVVVTDKGRVCAGIVGDSGQAGKDAIALTNRVGTLRNAAIVEAREVQITRHGQVVARIIPPERIPEYLPGWAPPAPNVAVPKGVAPKATTSKAAAHRTTAAPALVERHAHRRNLIREAVERRLAGSAGKKAGGAGSPKTGKREGSFEIALAKKDETLFAERDEMTEENLAVLDELLKG